jgi:non-ribosomal peptide synthetase component F
MNKTTPPCYPLSSPQREIWFDQLRHTDTRLYNIGGYMRIDGAIQPRLFEKAIHQVVHENEALRTVLHNDSPLPTQSFPKHVEVKVDFQDFSNNDNPHQRAIEWMENELVKPFQLYEQVLFQFALLKISPECYYKFYQYDHIMIDGWGISLINQRVAAVYNALLTDQPICSETGSSYREFIQTDQQYLTSDAYQRDAHYWRQKYQTRPEQVIPHRYANQFNKTISSQRQILIIKRDLYHSLTAFAPENQATTYHLILGVLYCYFIRTSHAKELTIGLSVLNRKTAAFKRTVGLFTSIIPARFRFGTDLNFIDLIRAIAQELRQEYRHQRFPMSDIIKSIETDDSQTPLFDIVMAYQKYEYPAQFAGQPAHVETLTNGFEHNTLFISVEEYQQNQDVRLTFDYQPTAFNQTDMALFAARIEWILESILQKQKIPIWQLNLIPDQEWQQIVQFNETSQSYSKYKTFIDLFEEQVEKTPEAIAVVFENQQLSYQQLNRKANVLAHYLQERGVKPEVLVGIGLERSIEMISGILAILKAGGAYVPFDPSYPTERLAFMLADSEVQLLLTQSSLQQKWSLPKEQLICLDTFWDDQTESEPSLGNPVSGIMPSNLAYVIYTSGSTGQPKGVLVEHGGLCNLVMAQIQSFQLQPTNHVLQFASLSFDVSISEIMMALGSGARLCLGTTESLLPGTALIQQLHEQQITHASFTPTALAVSPLAELFDLQYLIVGGETCSPEFVAQWSKNRHFFNAYGPTEATVCATQF